MGVRNPAQSAASATSASRWWIRQHGRGAAPALVLAGCVGLAVPAAFSLSAYQDPSGRAAIATMTGLLALAGAWLLSHRLAHSRRLGDVLLVSAAVTLALMKLALGAIPAALGLHGGTGVEGAELWAGIVVAAAFASAAGVPREWMLPPGYSAAAAACGLSIVALAAAGLGSVVARGPLAWTGGRFKDGSVVAAGHPVVIALILASTVVLGVAATRFIAPRAGKADRSGCLIGVALACLAAGSLYRLTPLALAPDRLTPGDGLALLACAVICAAAVVEDRKTRARLASAAAAAERRRVARDLHDGLAQDLAFIAAHGGRMAHVEGEEHPIVVAAKRALSISRDTIADLSDSQGLTTHDALETVARELSDRFEIDIAVDADEIDTEPVATERAHLVRIAREAIANAARHGHAKHVVVSLTRADVGVTLSVSDDGRGIGGTDRGVTEGFGLRSMRDSATSAGGALRIRRRLSGGTELEVVLPRWSD